MDESNECNTRITRKTTRNRPSKGHKRKSRDHHKKSPSCEKTEAVKTTPEVINDPAEETANGSPLISDQSIIRVMGKHNYGIVLNALCSLTDMVVKSQAICALLTTTKTYNDMHTQTASIITSVGSQTDDSGLCFGNVPTLDESQKCPDPKCVGKTINLSGHSNNDNIPYVNESVASTQELNIPTKLMYEPQSSVDLQLPNSWNNNGDRYQLDNSQVLNDKQTSIVDPCFVNAKDCNLSGKSIANTSSKSFNILDFDGQEIVGDVTERMSVCDSISTNCIIDSVTEMNKMIEMRSPRQPLSGKMNSDIRTWNSSSKVGSFNVSPTVVSTVADSTITTVERMVNTSPDFTQTVVQNIIHDRDTCLDLDESGYLPIHHAVMDNDLKRVTFLHTILKMRSTHIDHATTDDMFTPLHLAVIHNSSQAMITLLLKLGCSLLTRDDQDRNIFHHCAMQQDSCPLQTILTWLCQPFAEAERCANIGILLTGLTDTDISGNTPPMQCVLSWKSEHLMMMLQELDPKDAEVVVNFRNANNGMTALFLTTQCDIDGCGISRLSQQTKNCIKLLCDNNADWSIECFKGTTPIQFAQDCNNTDFIVYAATFTGEKRRPRQGSSGSNSNSNDLKKKFLKRVLKRSSVPDSEKVILPKKKQRKYSCPISNQSQSGVAENPSSMTPMMTAEHWIEGVFDRKSKICPKRSLDNFQRPIKIEPIYNVEEVDVNESGVESPSQSIPTVIYTIPPKDLNKSSKPKICIDAMTIIKAPEPVKKPIAKHKFTVPPIDLSKLPGRQIPSILLKGLKRMKVVDCNKMNGITVSGDKKVALASIKNDSISNFRFVTKIDKNKSVRVISTDHIKTSPEKIPTEVMPLQLKAFKIFKPTPTDSLLKLSHPVSNSAIKNVSLLKSPDAKLMSSLLKSNTEEKSPNKKGNEISLSRTILNNNSQNFETNTFESVLYKCIGDFRSLSNASVFQSDLSECDDDERPLVICEGLDESLLHVPNPKESCDNILSMNCENVLDLPSNVGNVEDDIIVISDCESPSNDLMKPHLFRSNSLSDDHSVSIFNDREWVTNDTVNIVNDNSDNATRDFRNNCLLDGNFPIEIPNNDTVEYSLLQSECCQSILKIDFKDHNKNDLKPLATMVLDDLLLKTGSVIGKQNNGKRNIEFKKTDVKSPRKLKCFPGVLVNRQDNDEIIISDETIIKKPTETISELSIEIPLVTFNGVTDSSRKVSFCLSEKFDKDLFAQYKRSKLVKTCDSFDVAIDE